MQTVRAFLLLLLALACFAGCASHEPVRHLSSDVCLIVPNLTTREEVVSFLGLPDERRTGPGQKETWYYYQPNKSFWRKTPLIGAKLGHEDYDLVTITFMGDQVTACVYRSITEDEFKKSGLKPSAPPESQ